MRAQTMIMKSPQRVKEMPSSSGQITDSRGTKALAGLSNLCALFWDAIDVVENPGAGV